MGKKLIFFLILLSGLFYIQSCKHEPIVPQGQGNTPIDSSSNSNGIPCDPDTAYFTEVQAILNSSCQYAGCHNSQDKQDGVDLSSYTSIINTADVRAGNPNGSDLYEVITETDPDRVMPPFPYNKLTSDQIEIIRTWIAQGAKNNYCDGCDTTSVTFSGQVSSIIENHCVSCHNDNLAQGSVKLTDYADVKTYVDNDMLLGVIKHEAGLVPMPYNQPKLDECKIRAIELWIEDGAQNN
ncbi:hypothetical protein GYB22_05860 [bacterium]|nr:hypothetical protein [bacterium]